ncbi:MAG: hypothetical protein ACSHWQ_08945 [Spongiibacteraceae bacterium]
MYCAPWCQNNDELGLGGREWLDGQYNDGVFSVIANATNTLKKNLFRRFLLSLLLLIVAVGSAAVATLVASQWRADSGVDNALAIVGAESEGLSAREHYLRQQVQHLLMAVVAPEDFRVVVSLQSTATEFPGDNGVSAPDGSNEPPALAGANLGREGAGQLASASLLSKNILILVDSAVVAAAKVDQIYQLVFQGLGMHAGSQDVLQIDALPFIQFDWAVTLRDRHLWTVFLATFWLVLLACLLALIPWGLLRGRSSAGDGQIYQDELRRLRYVATDEPGRVANVLADWLREESD